MFALLSPAALSPGAAVGIDLGTTSSSIAVVSDGKPKIVHSLTSTVRFTDPAPLVGQHFGAPCIRSAKRLIGRSFAEVQNEPAVRAHFGPLLENTDDAAALRCPSSNTIISPEEASAEILRALLDAAEAETGERADRAVIGVPAHFAKPQRDATRAAASTVGLESVKLLEEPVCAALAFGVGGADDELAIVFDLGGGTLDVALLMVGGGTCEVLSSAGEPWLGGDDVDTAIVKLLAKEEALGGLGARSGEALAAARALKEQLTVRKQAEVSEPASITLSRKQLEAASKPLFTAMQAPVIRACEASGVVLPGVVEDIGRGGKAARGLPGGRPAARPRAGHSLDRLLLVGAASRLHGLPKMLESLTGLRADTGVKPEEAVALGAAVQAGVLDGALEQVDCIGVLEAAMIRGLASGKRASQSKRRGR